MGYSTFIAGSTHQMRPANGSLESLTTGTMGPHSGTAVLRSGRPQLPFNPRTRIPPRHTRHHLTTRATASVSQDSPASAPGAATVYDRTYPLRSDSSLHVTVNQGANGEQHVTVATNRGGRLLLHWGVEGGKRYKGGWRLPGGSARPEGTIEYKNRALRTPFASSNGNGSLAVHLTFKGEEVSDYLNFVIKDEDADMWYDLNGTNYKVPLKADLVRASSEFSSSEDSDDEQDLMLPLSSIPPLPQDLSGVWAYMKWEHAGCPNRSKEEADREYAFALEELTMLLRRGASLEELRGVAAAGVGRYSDYIASKKRTEKKQKPAAASVESPSKPQEVQQQHQEIHVPEALVGLQAYYMWEQAGRPDSADFSAAAREILEQQLGSGLSPEEIERKLKEPQEPLPPAPVVQDRKPEQQVNQQAVEQKQEEQAPAAAPAPPAPVVLGESMGIRGRNPLDLINQSAPPKLTESSRPRETPLGPLIQAAAEDEAVCWYRVFPLGSKSEILAVVRKADPDSTDCPVEVVLTTDASNDLVLHWGVKKAGKRGEWSKPNDTILPPGTEVIKGGIAAETEFTKCDDEECIIEIGGALVPLQRVSINLPKAHGLNALTFVLRSEDGTRWWNDGGSNFNAPVPGPVKEASNALSFEDEISRIIVDAEVNSGGWTLMHRYNKAADLIGDIIAGRFAPADEAMACIFVWLRYSAIRQITWQRNYNTQPRILGAAQERLTHCLADACGKLQGPAKEWARLCLPAIGRGGNAQAVRDEILNIMHRNKISEVKGTWMEEFHQKLHNNTTPDDVPICEAYLAFLQSDGNLGAYWRTLSDAGISRARLESFDRPIVTDPVFWPEKKGALISEFSNYLKILKDVHSGADLQASASAAAPMVPSSAKGYLGYVLGHSNDHVVLPLLEAAVEARAEIAPNVASNRELLYLDLALENVVRAAAERGAAASGTGASSLIAPLLQNLALSLANNEEVCYCLKAWLELPQSVRQGQRPNKDEALRAMAVLDRIRRALADVSDTVSAAIGPISQHYGQAFGCDSWAVELFAEEVVRGGPAFAVSLALSSVEPAMRAAAELGSWQVISPGSVSGRLEVVPDLSDIQDKTYDVPTVLLAIRVSGEEEVPQGVVGLLSSDAPDVLSHLSVRSRNMKVLFAACYDQATLDGIAQADGQWLSFSSTAAGALTWKEADSGPQSDTNGASSNGAMPVLKVSAPKWCGKWVVPMDGFTDGVVGAKSKNLAGLRGRLPDWINLPASITVPFASFEEALKRPENRDVAAHLAETVKKVTQKNASELLGQCRDLAMQVQVPAEAQAALKESMKTAGIPVPENPQQWEAALLSLRKVWASKYNEIAFVSTRKVGIPFDSVRMAVLCQGVVPVQYAFVVHTHNPTTGDENEIYCELVRGLGEAIVSGTVPGAALSFIAKKDVQGEGGLDDPRVVLYPSKSEGMFVEKSLIFRSDSNGEDLEGYAGAGLYESVTTAETVRRIVDYSSDPIISDVEFRRKLMSSICRVGLEIEKALGSAQDIEGVVDPNGGITVVQTRPQM